MKTQILSLEPHDDLISIRDKLGWKQAGRILLVFPSTRDNELNRLFSHRLNLLLIQRRAIALGVQIALVTRNRQICAAAKKLGILTFRDLKQAHRSHWRIRHANKTSISPFRRFHHRSRLELEKLREKANRPVMRSLQNKNRSSKATSIIQRAAWGTMAVLVVLIFAVIFIPSAQIKIIPKKQIQEIEIKARASESVKAVNLIGGIPIHTISTLVKGQDQIASTGKMQMPFDQAHGEVRFTNLTNQPIKIPVGTVVMTYPQEGKPAIKFLTLEEENLNASYISDNKTTQSVDAPVQAQYPGSNGNLPPDSLIVTEGEIGYKISVTNPAATSGGTEREIPIPTKQDRQKLYNNLYQSLQQQAKTDLQKATLLSAEKTPGILLNQSPILNQVLEKTFLPAEDTPANPLLLTLHLEFGGQLVFGKDLQRLAYINLNANKPEGYSPESDKDIQIEILTTPEAKTSPDKKKTFYVWRMRTQRSILASIRYPRLAHEIRGLSPQEASAYIDNNFQLESKARITLEPAWWRWMPLLPFRMTIITNQ